MDLDLSIVIPSYNNKEKLKICLDSIKETTSNLTYEVIVVDNISTDGSREMVEEDFPWVTLVKNSENRFFNGANNQGFSMAKGRFCMTLNQDIEVKDNALELMVNYLKSHPDVGLVSCQLYYPDGTKQVNCWKFRNLSGIIAHSQAFKSLSFLYPGYYEKVQRKLRYLDVPGEDREVDNIMGACMMGPTEVIRKTGGFDDDILMAYTDDVLCIKVRKLGLKVVHLSSGYIIHHELKQIKTSKKLAAISDPDLFNYAARYVGSHALPVLYPLKFVAKVMEMRKNGKS